MERLKSIDLFAGIGGIRLGFDRAFGEDIETVFVSEWDENVQKTYKANFKDDFEIAGDITPKTYSINIHVYVLKFTF
jgi:DNA (cytosine-5)-methyltransferase 1